jgi:murein DD-endopeptidase MepM/ murein hydrolase activator NlpD
MPKLRQSYRHGFQARELFVHDGNAMRRVHISARTQMVAASAAFFMALLALGGLIQFVIGAPALSGAISTFASRQAEVSRMEHRVAALQNEVASIRTSAKQHVARLEARQVFLAAMLKGEKTPAELATLAASDGKASDPQIAAWLSGVEHEQLAMAGAVRNATEARYRSTAAMVAKLGLAPSRVAVGIGGPYEPLPNDSSARSVRPGQADPQFKALFNSWQRLDQLQTGIIAIPSARPVQIVSVASGFGVRSDPFRGGRAMHAGVDMPGPIGTPIYATADGRVGRTGWIGGYGNLVELEHGRGIQTRYGHLSSILVAPGTRVKRGQLVGLMGSTGRSTGSHLHYEVRIDGRAVNPIPFLQTSDYLLAMQNRRGTAVGGPVESAAK